MRSDLHRPASSQMSLFIYVKPVSCLILKVHSSRVMFNYSSWLSVFSCLGDCLPRPDLFHLFSLCFQSLCSLCLLQSICVGLCRSSVLLVGFPLCSLITDLFSIKFVCFFMCISFYLSVLPHCCCLLIFVFWYQLYLTKAHLLFLRPACLVHYIWVLFWSV